MSSISTRNRTCTVPRGVKKVAILLYYSAVSMVIKLSKPSKIKLSCFNKVF